MKLKILICCTFLIFLLGSTPGVSQVHHVHKHKQGFGCAEEDISESELREYRRWSEEQRVKQSLEQRNPAVRYAPVVFHIVRNTAGAGVTDEEVELALSRANEKFEAANIQFYQCSPPNIITSNYWYNMEFEYGWANNCSSNTPEYAFDEVFHVPNVINIYCVNTDGWSWAAFPWRSSFAHSLHR